MGLCIFFGAKIQASAPARLDRFKINAPTGRCRCRFLQADKSTMMEGLLESSPDHGMEDVEIEEASASGVGVTDTVGDSEKMSNRFDESLPPPRLMITQMVSRKCGW
jgi:hypothetical protein